MTVSVTKEGTETVQGEYVCECSQCGKSYTLECYADSEEVSIAGIENTFNDFCCTIPASIAGFVIGCGKCSAAYKYAEKSVKITK